MKDDPKTNNHCEGWNKKFFNLVGKKHPIVWKLIEALQNEENSVESIEYKYENGIRPKMRTKLIYINMQKRLKNLCQDFPESRKIIEEFLFAAGKVIRFKIDQ